MSDNFPVARVKGCQFKREPSGGRATSGFVSDCTEKGSIVFLQLIGDPSKSEVTINVEGLWWLFNRQLTVYIRGEGFIYIYGVTP